MPITAEEIKARQAELQRQYNQMRADLIALDGAIQDCEYWLSRAAQLEAPKD